MLLPALAATILFFTLNPASAQTALNDGFARDSRQPIDQTLTIESTTTDISNQIKTMQTPVQVPGQVAVPGQAQTQGGAPQNTAAATPCTTSATSLYDSARRDYTSGKTDIAVAEFNDYLRCYGNTELAPNAVVTSGATLQVCPLLDPTIHAEQGGPMADAPQYDCAKSTTTSPRRRPARPRRT